MGGREDGLPAGKEHERVGALGKLAQLEFRAGLARKRAGLPDLEALKRAQHHVPRRRDVALGLSRVLPVVEGLAPMRRQTGRLGGALHLDQAHPRPDEVEELPLLGVLEPGTDRPAVSAVAREQLVEERLRLGALRAAVGAPLPRELDERATNLLARQRHVGRG